MNRKFQPPIVPGGPDHLSHSQIDLWCNCPRKWEYRYIKHAEETRSDALIIGNVYHHALECNFKAKLELKHDLDIDILLDIIDSEWKKQVSEGTYIRWQKLQEGPAKDMTIELVCKYMEEMAPTITPAKVEEWLTAYIDNTKFVLRMDLETTDGVVIDHKTSAKAYTQAAVDKDMQASATAFALGKNIVFYNHVAVKTQIPKIQPVRTIRTQTEVNWWLQKVRAIIGQMKSGFAPPNEDIWLCSPSYCDFYGECRGDLYTTISTPSWE